MYDPKLRERLYCVVAPTLMVWGAEDRIVPLEHGHAYQAGIEGLRLVTIEKSGHMPLVEQPQPTAHWMIDSSQLQLKIPLKEASLYLWGTGQARHCFCPKCTAAVLRNPRTTPRD